MGESCDSEPNERTLAIDFNEMATGLTNESLSDALEPYGIDVRVITFDGQHHPPMIFDSDRVSGNDFHIGSPNEACLGCTPETCRGVGTGGAPFQPNSNCDRLHQGLIVSEDCNSTDPDAFGGQSVVIFEACTPFYLQGMTILNAPAGSYLKFTDEFMNLCSGLYALPIPQHHVNARVDVGPTTVQNALVGPYTAPLDAYTQAHCNGYPVKRVSIHLAGSALIDNLVLSFPAVDATLCVDTCPGVCCAGTTATCADSDDVCLGEFYHHECDESSLEGLCDVVCCVPNDRELEVQGTLVPVVACEPPYSARPAAECDAPVTLGACCARTFGTEVCINGIPEARCESRYEGTWFARKYCGDPDVDNCRLGQCCQVAPNDERKRTTACRKRGDITCPCEDVICPAGFDTELPCSKEGVCKRKSGWGWFSQYECRFGTLYGDVCGTGSSCTYQDQPCQCEACRCSSDNKGVNSALCTTPTVPTLPTTTAPPVTCPPVTSDCDPNKYRRECADATVQYNVFTPYQVGEDNAVCSPLAPCYEQCCGTDCRISATYVRVEGGVLFRYFFDNCVGATHVSVPVCAGVDLTTLKCKFIAPVGPTFELSSDGSALDGTSSSSSSDTSSSLFSSVGDDNSPYSSASETSAKDTCTILAACDNGVGVPIHANYHGVELFIPGTATLTTGHIQLVYDDECVDCGVDGPTFECAPAPTSVISVLKFEHAVPRLLAAKHHVCHEPPMPVYTMTEQQQRAATVMWADLADERLAAFLDCSRKPFTDYAPLKVRVPSDGACDYHRCMARLSVDHTRRILASAVLNTTLDGDRQLSLGHYSDAAQAYCCAEFLIDQLATDWKCGEPAASSRCGTRTVHPVASPSRGRPTLQDIHALERIDTDGRPELAIVAFDQCKLNKLTPEDNDVNDGVFEVSATAHIDGDLLLDYVLLVKPIAFGSRDDASLDVRFSDAGIPIGSRVYVSLVGGAEPYTVCYTADSVADSTPDCPTMSSARLFRSVRSAFAGGKGVARPINTETGARSETLHVALMTVYPPLGTRASAALDIRLDFEMVYRNVDATCTTRTNGITKGASGYAVIVPAPFRLPREGVPAYLEGSGICVGGDDAGRPCDEIQECPRGYCNLKSGATHRCFDTNGPGVDLKTSCSRPTQCHYGVCYGYKNSGRRGAYPELKQWLECVGAGCYGASAHSDWCKARACHTTVLEWSQHPDEQFSSDDLLAL